MTAQQLLSFLLHHGVDISVVDGSLAIDAPEDFLDDTLVSQIRANKAEMIALLALLDGGEKPYADPSKAEWPSSYTFPASAAQQRMLLMEELAQGQSYYNIPVAYKLTGELNHVALEQAFTQLLAVHDILRTSYKSEEQGYLQVVSAPAPVDIHQQDLTIAQNRPQALSEALGREANHNFDLHSGWPIRVALLKLDENVHVLSINIHHIAADGWSARRLLDCICQSYTASVNNENLSITRDYQYADYVQWQSGWLQSEQYKQSLNYWLETLAGMPQVHSLQADFIRPSMQSVSGIRYEQVLNTSTVELISDRARQLKTTPFVVLQAMFALMLNKYSASDDIVFGTAVANRRPIDFVNTVGLFVNTLVLRHNVDQNLTVNALIEQCKKVSDEAFAHQQIPFDTLVDKINPIRSLGLNPLVQIMLVLQDDASDNFSLGELKTEALAQGQDVAKFDLALHVKVSEHGLSCYWEYNQSLFKAEKIHLMAEHFDQLLNSGLARPEQKLNDVSLIDESSIPNDLELSYFAEPQCIHRLFEAQARQNPDAAAVLAKGENLSYRQLDQRARTLAAVLYSDGVKPLDRIAVCMEKSCDLVVAMMAIFKLGATYVPLDPYYPESRLAHMLQDSEVKVVLTHKGVQLPSDLAELVRLFPVDEPGLFTAELMAKADVDFTFNADDISAPAYIIYTSGSTGKPKGVLVSHKSLFYSLQANGERMHFSRRDSMPTIGSQAFGVSLLEILLPLSFGAAIQIVNKSAVVELDQLLDITNDCSVLHAVPSLMRQWIDALNSTENQGDRYPNLRLLLVGGEAVPEGLLQLVMKSLPGVRLLVLYGMTESAVVCSSYEPSGENMHHNCIGRAHPNSQFFVMNAQGQIQPRGIAGELYIGGASLAHGYVNKPDITAQAFVDHPYKTGEKLYKTGDSVRLLADGNHAFLGRVDHQVSLRGVRIELAEIEHLVAGLDAVRQAVAHVAQLPNGEQTLVLYFTKVNNTAANNSGFNNTGVDLSGDIRQYLRGQLPEYMQPSILQCLDVFPLNPNGKVDRKQLPAPVFQHECVEPEGESEVRMLRLWKAILGAEKLGVTDNFFEVGGHSLLATQLANKIRSEFSLSLQLSEFFEAATVRSCAQLIDKKQTQFYARTLISRDGDTSEELLIEEIIL